MQKIHSKFLISRTTKVEAKRIKKKRIDLLINDRSVEVGVLRGEHLRITAIPIVIKKKKSLMKSVT